MVKKPHCKDIRQNLILKQLKLNLKPEGFCKNCGISFSIRFLGEKNEQKFCKEKCKTQWHQDQIKKAKAFYEKNYQ